MSSRNKKSYLSMAAVSLLCSGLYLASSAFAVADQLERSPGEPVPPWNGDHGGGRGGDRGGDRGGGRGGHGGGHHNPPPPYYPPPHNPPPPPYYPPNNPPPYYPPPHNPPPYYPPSNPPPNWGEHGIILEQYVGRQYSGFSALPLRQILGIDRSYSGYRIEYVKLRASSNCGYQSASLIINDREVSEQGVGNWMEDHYFYPNYYQDEIGYEVDNLKIYLSGCFNVDSVGVKLNSYNY